MKDQSLPGERELSRARSLFLKFTAVFSFLVFVIFNPPSFAQSSFDSFTDLPISLIEFPAKQTTAIIIDPPYFEVTLQSGQILIDTLTLFNPDSIPFAFAFEMNYGSRRMTSPHPPSEIPYTVLEGSLPNPFDLQFSFQLPGSWSIGAEFNGSYFYITHLNSNLIHKLDLSGNLIQEFSIPGISGLRDLAYDGQFMYGGTGGNVIYQMDFSTQTLIGVINTPMVVRHIAYDESADGFWIGDWNSDLTLVNRFGIVLTTIPTSPLWISISGTAYDSWTPGGPYLWLFDGGQGPGTPQYLHQIDLSTGTPTGFMYDVAADFPGVAGQAGGLFAAEGIVPGTASIGGILRDTPDIFFLYELASDLLWLTIEPTSGTVPPFGSVYLTVTYNATGLAGGTYTSQLVMNTNDPVNPVYLIPVTMHVEAAAISAAPNPLVFDPISVNQQISGALHIYNQGEAVLTVSDIVSTHSYFSANPTQLTVSPGDSGAITVTFAPTTIGHHSGALKIASNDPLQDTLLISVEGVAEEETGISEAGRLPGNLPSAQTIPIPLILPPPFASGFRRRRR